MSYGHILFVAMRTTAVLLLCAFTIVCSAGCKHGWIQLNDKCYFFSHTPTSWPEAESVCDAFHSKLAEPLNNAESSFLISQSQNLFDNFWIGISDLIEEDRWIYASTQDPVKVNKFHTSQPNQHTSANCVALWKDFDGLWADEPCGSKYKFVCEMLNETDGSEVIG